MKLYEGINMLLASIGEAPITDDDQALNADALSDVGMARNTILTMNKTMQEEGWWFNKEVDYPLVPNENNKIPIGDNILSVVDTKYVVKDHKLWDIQNKTFDFTTTIKTTVVFLIDFDDLPNVMADVIVRESQAEFYNNVFGDTQQLQVIRQNAQRAQVALQKFQLKHKKANLISGSSIINRRQNPRGLE
jgi:hypothetical protein